MNPRLAFDPAEAGTDDKRFQGEFQFNEMFAGWWPQLPSFRSMARCRESSRDTLSIRQILVGAV